MQPAREIARGFGWLTVAATLFLSVPGIEAVRASDAAEQASVDLLSDGRSCSMDPGPNRVEISLEPIEVEAGLDPANSEHFIVLNNAGYAYGPPDVDRSRYRPVRRR
jgi:hypothetical protein